VKDVPKPPPKRTYLLATEVAASCPRATERVAVVLERLDILKMSTVEKYDEKVRPPPKKTRLPTEAAPIADRATLRVNTNHVPPTT
jgi:hypothetical protein